MNIDVIRQELECALDAQVALATGNAELADAAQALLAVLGPAVQQAGLAMAQQAADEVDAQLPSHTVNIIVSDGQPEIRLREEASVATPVATEDLHARLTVRLPQMLKEELELAASSIGDSVNTYVVKSLGERRRDRTRSSDGVSETFET